MDKDPWLLPDPVASRAVVPEPAWGEVLGQIFSKIGRSWRSALVLGVIVAVPSALQSALQAPVQQRFAFVAGRTPNFRLLAGIITLASLALIAALLIQVLVAPVVKAALGVVGACGMEPSADPGEALSKALEHAPAVIGAAVLRVLAYLAVALVAVLASVAGFLIHPALGALMAVAGFAAVLATVVVLGTWWYLALPLCVIKGLGAMEALRRSRRIVSPRFWPVLGWRFIVGVAVAIATSVVSAPFAGDRFPASMTSGGARPVTAALIAGAAVAGAVSALVSTAAPAIAAGVLVGRFEPPDVPLPGEPDGEPGGSGIDQEEGRES